MPDIPAVVRKVPPIVWVGGAGVALGLFILTRSKSSGGGTVPTTVVGDGGGGGGGSLDNGGGVGTPSSPDLSTIIGGYQDLLAQQSGSLDQAITNQDALFQSLITQRAEDQAFITDLTTQLMAARNDANRPTGSGGGTTPTPTPTAPRTVTFPKLSATDINTLKRSDEPLTAHQLHVLHLQQPVTLTWHQAHLLHASR